MDVKLDSMRFSFSYLSSLPEKELWILNESGDKSVLDFLLNKYKTVGFSILNKMMRNFSSMSFMKDDLEQETMIAIVRAINKFDYSKGTSFSTFMSFIVKYAIYDYIFENKRLVSIPKRTQLKVLQVYAYKMQGYECEYPVGDEYVSYLTNGDVFLGDLFSKNDSSSMTFEDNSISPEISFFENEWTKHFLERVKYIAEELYPNSSEKMYNIFVQRCGFTSDEEPTPFQTLGDFYGVTRQRIDALHKVFYREVMEDGEIQDLFEDLKI